MTRLWTALAAAAALAAACGEQAPAADASKGQIRADMKEYTITLTSGTVKAGAVTFIARDVGSAQHSFAVLRTDLAPDKLPIDQQKQQAKEDGKVGGLDNVDPGRSLNLRLDLPPGHYVLICNVPTHYQLGMRTELAVQ